MLNSQGSLSTVGVDTSAFSYSIPSAATSISFWWTSFDLPFADGTVVTVAAEGSSTSPAIAMTGLNPSTNYYFSSRYSLQKQAVEIMVSTASALTPLQSTQWLNADGYAPVFVSWNIATPAAGGGGGGGVGGFPTGFCFAGETRVLTVDGYKRFDELGPVVRIVNDAGEWDADVIVHEDAAAEIVPVGTGRATTNHLLRSDAGWTPAGESTRTPPEKFCGTLYNLHVRTDDECRRHYIVEPGIVVHNMKMQ